jgi:TolA-binding protein
LAAQVKPTAEVAEDLLWVQAEAARGAGQHADAIALYDQLAREQPRGLRSAAARFQAARLVQESGRWEEASNRYRELARDPMGRELAAEAWFASAYARIQIQQPTEAVSDWSVLIRDYPGFRALDEALYGHAQSESERGQGASARTSLERLLKDHPKSRLAPEAHYLLGTLLEAEDKWEGAEFHYRLAARENPDGALARRIEFRRVAVLQRQGRHEETASVLNGLLDAPAGSEGVPPALLDWLARWNLQQKDWAAAERAGLGLSKHGAAWTALGWFQVGVAREESGQRDSAREAYRKAAVDGASRESVESSYRLGRLATEAGDVAEAKASLSQAAERASKEEWADLRARSYLGLAHLAELGGDREEAARTFLSVALLYDDPTLTPEALFRAAQTLQALGRTVERDQTLKELRERYPETTWALRPLATP